jgi:diguanylate cyclase (GGDEF)-like protein/PAS domain S-box-containing protein
VAAHFPWFQEGIRSRGFTAGDAFHGGASGRWFSALTYPLVDDRGAVIGLLGMGLDLLQAQKRILPAAPKDVVVSVIDRQSRFLMRSVDPAQWIGKSVGSPETVSEARRGVEGTYRVTGAEGIARAFSYRTDPRTGWLISVGIPEDALFAPVRQRLGTAVTIVLVTLLFALIAVRKIGTAVAKPIRDLEATTEKVAEGDLTARAPVEGPAELANVARELNRMLDVRERADTQLRDLNRTLTVLGNCNEALARATGEQGLLDEMCRILVKGGGYELTWIGFAEDDKAKRVRPAAMAGATGYLETLEVSWGDDELGQGPTGTAIRSGQPVFVRDVSSDASFRPWRANAERFGLRSTIALPLGRDLHAFGALCIYSAEPNRFDEKEVQLLVDLANNVAYGIQSLRTDARRRQVEEEARLRDERFRSLIENSADGIALFGSDGAVLYVGPSVTQILGYLPEEMEGHSTFEFIHPDDITEVKRYIQESIARPEEVVIARARVRSKNGAWCRMEGAFTNLLEVPSVKAIVINFRDVTEREVADAHIKNLNRIYAVLSGINALIVRVHDREELFREACRIAIEAGQFRMAWLGVVDRDAMVVKPAAWHGDVRGFFDSAPLAVTENRPGGHGLAGRAVRTKRAVISNDARNDPHILMQKEIEERGIRSVAVIPLLVDGEAIGVLALYAADAGFFDEEEMKLLTELAGDISFALEHIERSEKLHYIAYYDMLTGLPNRTLFNELLMQRLSLRMAGPEHGRVALVLLDIERFKGVNDSLGRQAGDELLKQIARRLVRHAEDYSHVGRFGADQFAIMFFQVDHGEGLVRLLHETSLACFGEPFRLAGDRELRLSAKAGVALSPEDGADAETLHRNAEAALKQAKVSNEKFVFYARHMTEKVGEKLSLENKLRLALERDEFVLHYQPKVDLKTRRIEGVEALIRWQSPGLGLVPPLEFIPLMEETGMILEAGAWAMRRAVLDHRDWVKQGVAAPRISVNVSAIQLRKRDFVQTVKAALAGGARPVGLDLEITESLIMEAIEENIAKLAAIRDLGIDIAVDDFGTGYSSLRYLAKLPVQTLKIDRSFIITMLKDANTMTLVSTVISLAHSLGLIVVAEGVESEDQAKVLLKLKCNQIQGYLISRPVPKETLLVLLKAKQVRPA